jgi:hypothetical protein
MTVIATGGFFSSATSTMVSLWVLLWGIRLKGELDLPLDTEAKRLRWSMVALGLIIMTVATAPMFNSAWGAAIGWIWATAFLAWPNFAFHLTGILRHCRLLPRSESKGM